MPYSAVLRLRGKVLVVEPASDEDQAARLADHLRADVEVVVIKGRPRVSGLGKSVIQISADELRDGKPFKLCPKCHDMKDLNAFGLRRKVGAAKHGVDVITTQAWCGTCRGSSDSDGDTEETDPKVSYRCCCARCDKYDGCTKPATEQGGFCVDCSSGGPHMGFDTPKAR